MLAQSPPDSTADLAEEQRLASLELAAPRLDGYEIRALIGEGTYGDVWEARETQTGVIVAIKRLRKQPDAQSCAEVEKLARLGAARGIVALREVHLASEPYCYVMEHLEGGTLADLIHSQRSLPFPEAWRIFRQLIEALCYVHSEGIVHCDIKPANILLDSRGNPRLGDFGQARGRGPEGASLGTRFYMPPEQARMEGVPDPRWDVYALGAVLYEMLTGVKPRFDLELSSLLGTRSGTGSEFRDRLEQYARHLEKCPPPQAHRQVKQVDSSAAALIDRCLSLDFPDRPQDAGAVLKLIAQADHARASRPLLVFGGLAPAIMLLLLGIFLFGVGYFTLSRLSGRWTELVKANNPIAAQAVARDVKELFDSRAKVVQQESQDPRLIDWVNAVNHQQAAAAASPELLQEMFQRNADLIYRWSVGGDRGVLLGNFGKLQNADGTESIGVDDGSNGKNYAWRGWFNGQEDRAESLVQPRDDDLRDFQARRRNRPFVAQPYSRKGNNQFMVVGISCAVAAADGKQPIGVLSGLMAYDKFFESINEIADQRARGGQNIVIVNDHSQVLFHSNKRAWTAAAGSPFQSPQFPACEHFQQAFADPAALAKPRTAFYQDPIDHQRCWGAVQVVNLESGQKLAIFVQQNDQIAVVWTRAIYVAGGLLVVGAAFLATNSYALYWTLRQHREASTHV